MIARPTASSVSIISTGTSTVSDGPRRVARMRETSSLVDQLAPKSKVSDLLHEHPELYQ